MQMTVQELFEELARLIDKGWGDIPVQSYAYDEEADTIKISDKIDIELHFATETRPNEFIITGI